MPRVVDQDARRRQIAEALWRLTSARGLEAVSLRHVADEAGVSMGMVQHYFTTRDQMCLFALESMRERVTRRIGERIEASPDPGAPRWLVHGLLVEMLPIDDERRTEAQVGFAFMARAIVEPALAASMERYLDEAEAFVAAQIRRAQELGDCPRDVDPEQEAHLLLAVVDGLAVHTLVGRHTPEAARQALEVCLSRLFAPATRP